MIGLIMTFLGAIPGIGSIVTSLTTAFFNAKVELVRAQAGVDIEKARQLVSAANVAQHERTAALGVIAGNRVLTWLVVAFATPLVIFIWKVVVIDIVIGPGNFLFWTWVGETDPIRGQVADWATTIIWSLFGAGTAVSVSSSAMKMWFDKGKG